MNITLLQCSTRLPALLNQSPAGLHCARHRWQHSDHTRHAAQPSFIGAQAVIGNRLATSFITSLGVHTRPAHFKSP